LAVFAQIKSALRKNEKKRCFFADTEMKGGRQEGRRSTG
jgi:hypothetical protein